jgi:hypothetical protein
MNHYSSASLRRKHARSFSCSRNVKKAFFFRLENISIKTFQKNKGKMIRASDIASLKLMETQTPREGDNDLS